MDNSAGGDQRAESFAVGSGDYYSYPFTLQLEIGIKLRDPVTLVAPISDSNEGRPRVSYLPPVTLSVRFPDGYPSDEVPQFEIDSSWLPQPLVQRFEECGKRIWREQEVDYGTVQAVHGFINHVQSGFTDDFGISKVLEIEEGDIPTFLEFDRQATFEHEIFECGVCMDTKPGALCHRLRSCSHVFCIECLQDFYNTSIKEGDVSKVTCMQVGCESMKHGKPRTIKPSELAQIRLEPGNIGRYVRLKRKRRIELDPTTVYCPIDTCQAPARSKQMIIHKNLDSDTDESDSDSDSSSLKIQRLKLDDPTTYPPLAERAATCSQCNYEFCKICRIAWHGQSIPCVSGSGTELTAEEQASEDYLKLHSQRCPSCQTPAQKSRGCNHMVCPRCQTNYCFLCGAMFDKAAWAEHFSTVGQSCYERLWEHRPGDDNEAISEDSEEDDEVDEIAVVEDIFAVRAESSVFRLYVSGGAPFPNLMWNEFLKPVYQLPQTAGGPDAEVALGPERRIQSGLELDPEAGVEIAAEAAREAAAAGEDFYQTMNDQQIHTINRWLGQRIEQSEQDLLEILDLAFGPLVPGYQDVTAQILRHRDVRLAADDRFLGNLLDAYGAEVQGAVMGVYIELINQVFGKRVERARRAAADVRQAAETAAEEVNDEMDLVDFVRLDVLNQRLNMQVFLNVQKLGNKEMMVSLVTALRDHELNGNITEIMRVLENSLETHDEYEERRLRRLELSGFFTAGDRLMADAKTQRMGLNVYCILKEEGWNVAAASLNPVGFPGNCYFDIFRQIRREYEMVDGDDARLMIWMERRRAEREYRDEICSQVIVGLHGRDQRTANMRRAFRRTTAQLYTREAWQRLRGRLIALGLGWEERTRSSTDYIERALLNAICKWRETIHGRGMRPDEWIEPDGALPVNIRTADKAPAGDKEHLEPDKVALYRTIHHFFPDLLDDDTRLASVMSLMGTPDGELPDLVLRELMGPPDAELPNVAPQERLKTMLGPAISRHLEYIYGAALESLFPEFLPGNFQKEVRDQLFLLYRASPAEWLQFGVEWQPGEETIGDIIGAVADEVRNDLAGLEIDSDGDEAESEEGDEEENRNPDEERLFEEVRDELTFNQGNAGRWAPGGFFVPREPR